MHLPGHSFAGPGTKLKKQLNPDLTPKKWSKPVNDDTSTRNAVCDKNMLKELEGIYNPSLLERVG